MRPADTYLPEVGLNILDRLLHLQLMAFEKVVSPSNLPRENFTKLTVA